MPPLIRFHANFEKGICSLMLKLLVAVHLSLMDILICVLCVHDPCRCVQISTFLRYFLVFPVSQRQITLVYFNIILDICSDFALNYVIFSLFIKEIVESKMADPWLRISLTSYDIT